MKRSYKIADIVIQLNTDFDFVEDDKYTLFAERCNQKPDYIIHFQSVSKEIDLGDFQFQLGEHVYYQGPQGLIEAQWRNAAKEEFRWLFMNDSKEYPVSWVCKYLKKDEGMFRSTSVLFRHIGFNVILDRMKALLLHCSFISVENKAILFSGPSGIGKSTQADLWSKYEDADVLNGDRAIIRIDHGVLKAYGLPYAGSSNIYRNESCPLGTIVILDQALNNEVFRLSRSQAFREIFSEIIQSYASRYLQSSALDILEDVVNSVPVFFLRCRPEKEAVQLLKSVLLKEGIL